MLLILTVFWFTFSFPVFAVPAEPGGEEEGGECFSVPSAEPVTLELLEQRKAEQEEMGEDYPMFAPSETVQEIEGKAEGTLPLLIIVVGFDGASENRPEGMHYVDSFDWGTDIFVSSESLTQYYLDMSFGKFTFVPAAETSAYGVGGNTNTADRENDGIVHVVTAYPHESWCSTKELVQSDLFFALKDAVEQSSEYVDYAGYDTDHDGMIDTSELAIGFVIAGFDPSIAGVTYSEGRVNYFWAHAWTLDGLRMQYHYTEPVPMPDGVIVNNYIAIPEQLEGHSDADPKRAYLSTLFHELGHYLGLPDLYNTQAEPSGDWVDYQVKFMSLMANGCWGIAADGTSTPYSMDVWSRCVLGWITPEEMETGTATLTGSLVEPGTVLRIPATNEKEFYLVENHRFTGWDRDMAYGISREVGIRPTDIRDGIVVWHIDSEMCEKYKKTTKLNVPTHRPGVMPLYPEEDKDGNVSLMGDVSIGPIRNPFFSADGEEPTVLALPCYGKDEMADSISGRFVSCVRLTITSEPGDEMQVEVSLSHTPEAHKENYLWPEGGEAGGYDRIVTCSVCGCELEKTREVLLPTGWQKIGNKWYYYDEKGAPMRSAWISDLGKWYYLGEDGSMATGWQLIGGKWYYFTPGGGAMKTGWLYSYGKWYYLRSDGVMVTGWRTIGNATYFFKSNGTMAANEYVQGYRLSASGAWSYKPRATWRKSGKGWWYGDTSGWYAAGETRIIDGKSRRFNAAGYLQE